MTRSSPPFSRVRGVVLGVAAAACGLLAGVTWGAHSEPSLSIAELEQRADIVVKATVVGSVDVTDAWFDDVGGFGVRETELRVISVVKGEPSGSTIRFRHYTGLHGTTLYPYEPPHYELEVGRAYLIFGSKADDGAYRQLDKTQFDDPTQGTLLAADDQPHRGSTASEAARFELEGLLASQVSADVVYAIRKLDAMRPPGVTARPERGSR